MGLKSTKKASSEYYSMNRNIHETKILPRDGHKPEFLFLGQEINNAVQTEIICENNNLGFDVQIRLKDGNYILYHNVNIIHWCVDGKWAFVLETNNPPEVQTYPFKNVVRVEVLKSLEQHSFINSKIKS